MIHPSDRRTDALAYCALSMLSRAKNCYMGSQLDELLASVAARWRVCLKSSQSSQVAFNEWVWQSHKLTIKIQYLTNVQTQKKHSTKTHSTKTHSTKTDSTKYIGEKYCLRFIVFCFFCTVRNNCNYAACRMSQPCTSILVYQWIVTWLTRN